VPTIKLNKINKSKFKSKYKSHKMGEELPILKGILKGNVNYHNARKLRNLPKKIRVKQ